jgi:hypothetical protein
MKLRLVKNYPEILKRAWSMRFAYAGVLLSSGQVYFAYKDSGSPPVVAILALLASIGFGVARIVYQGIEDGDKQ